VAAAIAKSRAQKLDFVVLTPHAADERMPDPDAPDGPRISGQDLTARRAREALDAPADPNAPSPRPLLVVPGWELTRETPGHLSMAFFRMDEVTAPSGGAAPSADVVAQRVVDGGGLVAVAHPFFRRVRMLPVLEKLVARSAGADPLDKRWRPFFGEAPDPLCWNAIEVWHERSVLVQKAHAGREDEFPETQMVRDALAAWDRAVRERRRRIVAVGGSDCHGKLPYAVVPMRLVGVAVDAFDAESLRKGLVAGRVTFGRDGGLAASDLAATSDVEGERAGIGDSLRAKAEVRLTWAGRAVLVEDGTPVGEFEGGAVRTLDPPGSFHSWRIERPAADAWSNPVYANL